MCKRNLNSMRFCICGMYAEFFFRYILWVVRAWMPAFKFWKWIFFRKMNGPRHCFFCAKNFFEEFNKFSEESGTFQDKLQTMILKMYNFNSKILWYNIFSLWLNVLDQELTTQFFQTSSSLQISCLNLNKARLFEGSFSWGVQFDPPSYFKKDQSNVKKTLYNCWTIYLK